MEVNTTFIHIEASSNELPSFPAEIYWGTIPSKGSTGYLINPEGIARWKSWDTDFYSIHHITPDDLQTYGTHPAIVCNAINQHLCGKAVYCKEPEKAKRLIGELFFASEIEPDGIAIIELDELFLQMIRERQSGNAMEVLREIKERVAKEYSHYLGGGAFEVLYYSEIWQGIFATEAA